MAGSTEVDKTQTAGTGKTIREKHSNLLLIGMSTDEEYKEKSPQEGFSTFIEKPVAKKHL